MFFTKEDFQKIEEYLRQNSMKDTDFQEYPDGESFNPEDIIVIVHNGINYKLPIIKLDGVIQILDRWITERMIASGAITPDKLSDEVKPFIIDETNQRLTEVTEALDSKYQNITDNIESVINNILQKFELSLDRKYGDNTDRGIQQKTLTDSLHMVLAELSELNHKQYTDYTTSVNPVVLLMEPPGSTEVTADATEAIAPFDSIKFYVNDVLEAESSDVRTFTSSVPIVEDSNIRIEGTILGKVVYKEHFVRKIVPFFIGGGQTYSEIMNDAHLQPLIGTLEGDYNITIPEDGDHIFIIIPSTREREFRRADLNGIDVQIEIPFARYTFENYIVFKSLNTYQAGTYNIDIDINT